MGKPAVFVATPPRRHLNIRWVTPLLMLLMLGVFIWLQTLPEPLRRAWLLEWGTVAFNPALVWDHSQWREWLKPITALFLHADWTHLIGKMVFLMIFALPAERMMGSRRFLLLFLAGGAIANLAAAISLGGDDVVIGASGAVSAVLGAWLALFPRGRLGVVVPLGLFLEFVHAPAALLIGMWVLLQLLFAYAGPAYGQVAWVAHLAGFGFGGVYAIASRNAIQKRMRRQAGY